MHADDSLNEQTMTERLIRGDMHAFKQIYRSVFPELTRFAYGILHNQLLAEEMAQATLVHLWEIRESLSITSSLNAYLFRAIRNKCIDHLRHRRIIEQYNGSVKASPMLTVDNTEQYLAFMQLQEALMDALAELPPEIANAFRKNRFEARSYESIAAEEGVSVRTVEYRISRALAMLREKLTDFQD